MLNLISSKKKIIKVFIVKSSKKSETHNRSHNRWLFVYQVIRTKAKSQCSYNESPVRFIYVKWEQITEDMRFQRFIFDKSLTICSRPHLWRIYDFSLNAIILLHTSSNVSLMQSRFVYQICSTSIRRYARCIHYICVTLCILKCNMWCNLHRATHRDVHTHTHTHTHARARIGCH